MKKLILIIAIVFSGMLMQAQNAIQMDTVLKADGKSKVEIYNAIKYENVYPVIMCGDVEAKHIIGKAIKSVEHILPSTNKITISLIH